MIYLQIRNWRKFQHYHDGRRPTWIKLYAGLRKSVEFMTLPDAAKAHVIGLFLLAAEMGNKLPANAPFLGQQIGATEPVDLELLQELGWIEPWGASTLEVPYQDGTEPLDPPIPPQESAESRIPPRPPPGGGGRALDTGPRADLEQALERLVAQWIAIGELADRPWRRLARDRLRSGVAESHIAAEIDRLGDQKAQAARAALRWSEARSWIESHGGERIVALSIANWLERERHRDEAESEALDRWASEVPPGVLDQVLRELRHVQRAAGDGQSTTQARAHSPPAERPASVGAES